MPRFLGVWKRYLGYGARWGDRYGDAYGNIAYSNCYTSLNNSDTIWGHIEGDATLDAQLTPDTTADGTLIYQSTFDTSDGSFIMAFGAAGDEQLDNCLLIIKEFDSDQVELYWDATNEYYYGVNQTLATSLALLTGTRVCMTDIAIPDLLIDITFEELEVV